VGAFLSGGLDSTTIVALAQRQATQPTRTFTIGFDVPGYDETAHAAAVARALGTRHIAARFGSDEALEIIPRIATMYDEPHADPSQLPTYFVSRLAREHVTVALTGDGGDELFCGYVSYFNTDRIWRTVRGLPKPLRAATAAALRSGAGLFRNSSLPVLEKLYKVSTCLNVNDQAGMFECLVDTWRGCFPVRQAERLAWWRPDSLDRMKFDPWQGMSMQDLLTYMPDAILAKVDRAAMAVSLETRVPFLDHRVVEFAMGLPTNLKVRDGQGKFLLRRLLARYVPTNLWARPKSGFGVPIGVWLTGPLRDWAEDLLDETKMRTEGYFDVPLVRRRWHEHLRGYRDWKGSLWNVLMFQAWIREQHAGSDFARQPMPSGSPAHAQ
jgi:asparagine synthase (glutamine-hydrolysing)